MKYENILESIGNTPVVRLNKIGKHLSQQLWCKLESFNPGGSVKDRPALNMIVEAEQAGELKPGDTIIEPTSGNTGIGLAMVAAVKGYKAVFVMSEDMSQERKAILKAYGAQIVLTPAEAGTIGAIDEARKLARENGYFFVGQHFNPSNPAAHISTANELWDDFGEQLNAVICTTGTGGTISGVGKILKSRHPGIKMIATEPLESPILSKGISTRHKIMGTAPGFIPDTLDTDIYDQVISVKTSHAFDCARQLAAEEGIFAGISCGAAVVAMQDYAKRFANENDILVAVLADTGERYLSTELWD